MPVLVELEWRALERGRVEGREAGAQAELVAAIAEVLAIRFEAAWRALGETEQETLRDRFRSLALSQLQPLHQQALLTPALADFVVALPALALDSAAEGEP